MGMARNWRHVQTRIESTTGGKCGCMTKMRWRRGGGGGGGPEDDQSYKALACVFGKIHFHMLPAQGFTEFFVL